MYCITFRDENEWIETVETGWNKFLGAEFKAIVSSLNRWSKKRNISEYGEGKSSIRIVEEFSKNENLSKFVRR